MTKTNSGLVEYCRVQVGRPYWFGTFGQTASAQLYYAKKNQYPDYYTASNFQSQYGQRVHDCAGLIKGYLWSDGPNSSPTYKASQDYGATGFYTNAKKKGAIGSFDMIPGRLVFRGSNQTMKHVGVFVGNNTVIEAKGHAYGVITSKFSGGGWTHWAQCHLIEEDEPAPTPPSPTPTPGTATYTVKTRGGSLSLRKAPNLSAEVLANMPNGTKVQVSEIVKGEPCNGTTEWAHVPDYKGVNGFCTCSWLVKDVTPPTYAKYKVKTNTGVGLRLRAAPTTASAMLALIPNGTVLTVTATQNGWACTSYGGYTGWACMDYLVKL